MSVKKILQETNQGDQKVAIAVGQELAVIKSVVETIIKSSSQGSRLIYMGVDTSGRLGVLDTVECVPTFGVEPKVIQSLTAGGQKIMTVTVEGAEDLRELDRQDLADLKLSANDIIVGIIANDRTPYIINGLEYAIMVGAATATVAYNKNAKISKYVQMPTEVDTGPKFSTGSTRLKFGTAQKLILDMLSTISMIGIGEVCNNSVVNVKLTDEKLVERSKRIIIETTGYSYEVVELKSVEVEEGVKLAVAMILTDSIKREATRKLIDGNQFIGNTLN